MKCSFAAGWNFFILFSNLIRRFAAANLLLNLALWEGQIFPAPYKYRIIKYRVSTVFITFNIVIYKYTWTDSQVPFSFIVKPRICTIPCFLQGSLLWTTQLWDILVQRFLIWFPIFLYMSHSQYYTKIALVRR